MGLSKETIDFIEEHINDDVRKLALKSIKSNNVDVNAAIVQIAARRIARVKIPKWFNTKGLLYPVHLSMEQCSSQRTAQYKSSFLKGNSFTDLTGGLGIDFSFIAANFKVANYVERNRDLCEIAENNFPLLGLTNFFIHNGDGVEYLESMDSVDLIFIDPARRDGNGGKIVAISDCEPDVAQLEELLVSKAKRVVVKLSPMLDMSMAIKEMKYIFEIHIISVDNECKELLLLLDKQNYSKNPVTYCVNITSDREEIYRFLPEDEKKKEVEYAINIGSYLYEPNSSIMKAGAYKSIASSFNIKKLNVNSHLYTSEELNSDFPGRVFRVNSYSGFSKKELKEFLKNMDKANITVRNFPASVEELRKRTKLKDGGDNYIFATTLADEKKVLICCEKVIENKN